MASTPPPSSGFDLTNLTNASTLQAGVMASIRLLIVLIGGFTTLVGMIGRGNLEGLYAFFAGNEGLVFLTALITVGTFAYGIFITVRRHQKLVVAQTVARSTT